jgi:EmrB/QacA subfamily drug resistance transporter
MGAPAGAPHLLTPRERIAALTGVLLALLLAALDQTIVSTAGPAIQRSLRVSASTYPWITTAYLVASTVMVPIYGKLSDLFGRKPVLLTGVCIFLTGSLLCGLSPTAGTLIAARALQGLGAAALFTSAFTVIADLFPAAERGKYAGFIGGVMAISSVVGPLAGGILTDTLGWHWVFFVNLPIGAVALWFIVRRMPRLATSAAAAGHRPRIDVAGALALVTAVVPLLVALSIGRSANTPSLDGHAWTSGLVLGLFALAAAGAATFVLVERRAPDPILDLRLFRSAAVGLGTAAAFVLGAAFLAAVVFLPLYLVNAIGVSATRAGLTMMPLTLGVVAGSIGGGQIVARTGRYRTLMLVALSVLATGFTIMAFTLRPDSSQLEVTLKMILVGLGVGPTFPIYTIVVQNASEPRDLGVVTAALTFSRSLGQVIGVAVFGTMFAATLTSSLASRVGIAVRDLPEATRAVVAPVVPAGGAAQGEGAAAGNVAFDVVAARERVLRQLPDGSRAAAIAALDRVGAGVRHAYTDATRRLYFVGMVLALVTLALSAGIPELPLRRGPGPPAPATPE